MLKVVLLVFLFLLVLVGTRSKLSSCHHRSHRWKKSHSVPEKEPEVRSKAITDNFIQNWTNLLLTVYAWRLQTEVIISTSKGFLTSLLSINLYIPFI